MKKDHAFAAAATEKSRVVSVSCASAVVPGAGKDDAALRADVVGAMVNRGILEFTGEHDLKAAWRRIIPDVRKKVAIKINCQIQGIFTKARVVQPLIEGLLSIGVQADHIVIYDMRDKAFAYAGFRKNMGAGVKVGTVAEFGGYSRFLFNRLSNLLTGGYGNSGLNGLASLADRTDNALLRWSLLGILKGQKRPFDCEYLINVPVLKALDDYCGVTLSMKNHYGSIANPGEHHEDIMDYIPYINSLPPIREKTRLIVLDAIFGEYRWINGRDQSTVVPVNKILVSDDPVAVDFVGWKMIEQLRREAGLGPVEPAPDYIGKAAMLGLGNAEPGKIELRALEISA